MLSLEELKNCKDNLLNDFSSPDNLKFWEKFKKQPDDYVIATGKQFSIRQFINLVTKKLNLNIVWKGKGLNEKGYETITKNSSLAFNWSESFLDLVQNSGGFEYRNQIYTNFLVSIIILLLVKVLF